MKEREGGGLSEGWGGEMSGSGYIAHCDLHWLCFFCKQVSNLCH